ncbi:MAG TPA: hypothetical protein VGN17_11575 [Bryobacteraceae bacterium]
MPDEFQDAWVTLRVYESLFDAQLVRAELETCEIDVQVADEFTIGVNWQWRNLLGGVRLQVRGSQWEEADGVLRAEREEQGAPEESPRFCFECGSANTHWFFRRRGAVLTWLVLGFPIFRVASKQVCGDCGYTWRV